MAIKDEASPASYCNKSDGREPFGSPDGNFGSKSRFIIRSNGETTEKTAIIKINYLADTERQLEASLGRKVVIKDNSKKGIIELEYYGNDDREALIDALLKFGSSKRGQVQ